MEMTMMAGDVSGEDGMVMVMVMVKGDGDPNPVAKVKD